jgi:hypothetical protein
LLGAADVGSNDHARHRHYRCSSQRGLLPERGGLRMGNHRRLTRLEIKLLGQKLAVAEIIAENNEFAIAAKALIGGYLHAASLDRDLHHEDIVRIIEEAFRITKYRLENLGHALGQAKTGDLLPQ